MKKHQKAFIASAILWAVFLLYTISLRLVDVRAIGPLDSSVGFAGLNQWMASVLGSHSFFYDASELFGLVVLLIAGMMGLFVFIRFLQAKGFKKMDKDLIWLVVCYGIMAALYVLFEEVIVNYRPVLEEGILEASYPSSHTMLALVIVSTALIQWNGRIQKKGLRLIGNIFGVAVAGITVVGRLLSGVHWFTDILGGILLSAALVVFYYALYLRSLKKEV